MVKTIIITETITSGIIRWINVNQFDLSAKLLFEGMECDEVVAFDDEIFANDAVFVPLNFPNFIFKTLIVPPPFVQYCFWQCSVSNW